MACCRHFTDMVRDKSFSGLRKKLDTLHVQTRPFISKYRGFDRKQPHYKDITLFLNPLNPKLFICFTLNSHTNILKFQECMTSFGNFNALNDFFSKSP